MTAPTAAPWRACLSALLLLLTLAGAGIARAQVPTAAADDVLYELRPGDTLIGLARRCLVDPEAWRELQRYNRLANERRLPVGRQIRLPLQLLRLQAEQATVETVHGAASGDGRLLQAGDLLVEGARLLTGEEASATLRLPDASTLVLQPGSVLLLERLRRVVGIDAFDVRFRLERGRAETQVPPRRDRGRFEIQTPTATSAVRGTHFRASYDTAAGASTTGTLEGQVGVAAPEGDVAVAAGFGTRVKSGEVPLPPVALLPAPGLAALPGVQYSSRLRFALGTVPGAVAYRVQLSRRADFHAIEIDAQLAGTAVDLPAPPDGEWFVRARAIDANGIEGLDQTTTLRQLALVAPAALTPAPGADLHVGEVAFQWQGSGAGASTRVELARSADFATVVASCEAGTAAACTLDLPGTGTYHWRLVAVGPGGERGDPGESRVLNRRVAAPAAEPAVHAARAPRLLAWAGEAGRRHEVQVARDARFRRVVEQRTVEGTQTLLQARGAGTWWYRVRVVEDDGYVGPWGDAAQVRVAAPRWVGVMLWLGAVAATL